MAWDSRGTCPAMQRVQFRPATHTSMLSAVSRPSCADIPFITPPPTHHTLQARRCATARPPHASSLRWSTSWRAGCCPRRRLGRGLRSRGPSPSSPPRSRWSSCSVWRRWEQGLVQLGPGCGFLCVQTLHRHGFPRPTLIADKPCHPLQMDRLHAIPAALKSKWDTKFLDLLYTVITDKKVRLPLDLPLWWLPVSGVLCKRDRGVREPAGPCVARDRVPGQLLQHVGL